MQIDSGQKPPFNDQQSSPERTWSKASLYALFMLMLINAINQVDRNLFGLMMPLIKADIAISDTMLGVVSGLAFALFYGLAGVPIGYLADRWSRRNIISIGLILWSAATITTGMARNVVQLVLSRFFLGVGEASGTAPATSMIADFFKKEQRPLAMSCFAMAGSVGMLIGFPILGWVSEQYGWQRTFIVSGIFGIVLALIFLVTVAEPQRGKHEATPGEKLNFKATARMLANSPAYLLLVLTSVLLSIMLSASMAWTPSYLVAAHGMTTAEVGIAIGFFRGPSGIAGALIGGALTTVMARNDARWLYRVPAIMLLLACPSQLFLLYAEKGWMVNAGLALENFFTVGQIGPVFALVITVTTANTRAVAIALLLLAMNIIGPHD